MDNGRWGFRRGTNLAERLVESMHGSGQTKACCRFGGPPAPPLAAFAVAFPRVEPAGGERCPAAVSRLVAPPMAGAGRRLPTEIKSPAASFPAAGRHREPLRKDGPAQNSPNTSPRSGRPSRVRRGTGLANAPRAESALQAPNWGRPGWPSVPGLAAPIAPSCSARRPGSDRADVKPELRDGAKSSRTSRPFGERQVPRPARDKCPVPNG